MPLVEIRYISTGGNRHPSAADWDNESGRLAYGADQNIAIWKPLGEKSKGGVSHILRGHNDKVTAVRFVHGLTGDFKVLLTGSANGELRVWQLGAPLNEQQCHVIGKAHQGSLNAISVVHGSRVFATAGADTKVKIWRVDLENVSLLHAVPLQPRYIPLTLALSRFPEAAASDSMFLAVGGTRNSIQVYALTDLFGAPHHDLQATLSGHEGWVRSLALRSNPDTPGEDLLLASASQDKYVRLWRLHCGDVVLRKEGDLGSFEQTLTGKVQAVEVPGAKYSITFEALLMGHEDWVYTSTWNPKSDTLQLLTASADNSLTIWEPDPTSGIWVTAARLGEISGQKGATTATGSAGGFWIGLWSSDGQAVVSLGRTGSWRLWTFDQRLQYWVQKAGISGHFGPVNGLSWEKAGKYLLSTGSDQTTRLHAEWQQSLTATWHEFARPQIHGYDLNCIENISPQQFVSGADEKLLRVFNEPRAIAGLLSRLCKIDAPKLALMAESANIPVLGLSNKGVDASEDLETLGNGDDDGASDGHATKTTQSLLDIEEPPSEDVLARHTLWPEYEKLYGHGYEISEVAASQDGTIVATSCKASSIDHAVIRLYDTTEWHEIKPPLTAHSLTVTRLRFTRTSDQYLLSVGRDRQWSVFQPSQDLSKTWVLFKSNAAAHSRMILDAAWSPIGGKCFFATAGRDKLVKLWKLDEGEFVCATTLPRRSPVTAIDFTSNREGTLVTLAVGEETGQVSFHIFEATTLRAVSSMEVARQFCPSKSVTRLAWRPNESSRHPVHRNHQLALASADSSLRIMSIRWEERTGSEP